MDRSGRCHRDGAVCKHGSGAGAKIALVVNGIHLLENMKLDELPSKNAYEFAFIMQPLKIQGGSGTTVAPVAVR